MVVVNDQHARRWNKNSECVIVECDDAGEIRKVIRKTEGRKARSVNKRRSKMIRKLNAQTAFFQIDYTNEKA